MTILPMLDYGDIIYRSAGKDALERLDVHYHSAIRFATNAPYRTHHCTLYSSVNWSSLYTCRKTHWLMLIYKTLLGLTRSYLRYLLQSPFNTRSASHILLKVPKAHTSLGRSSFSSLQLATGTSCNKHSNWRVLSQSLHSKTQPWTLLLTVVDASRDVLLSLPCPLCCCLCPILFGPCCVATMLLSCCYHVATMLLSCCYHDG
jgi:hypothetical protein